MGGFAVKMLFHITTCFEQSVEINAGLHTHCFQHKYQVVGNDIATGAWRMRATAEPAQRGIKSAYPDVKRSINIGQTQTPRVMEMRGNRNVAARPVGH